MTDRETAKRDETTGRAEQLADLILRWQGMEQQALEPPANQEFAELAHRTWTMFVALRAERRAAWQPIETAPKGEAVLIAAERGRRVVGEAMYHDREEYGDSGWWWANEGPGDYHAEQLDIEGWTVMAWMPLPEPPRAAEAALASPEEKTDD